MKTPPRLLGCIAAAMTAASCECGGAHAEGSVDDEDDLLAANGLFLSTATESAARASRVLPNGPTEDARAVLGQLPPPTEPPVPESERDYGPNEAIDFIVTIELPDGIVLSRSRITTVLAPAWRVEHGRPTLYGRSAGRWTYVGAADSPDSFDGVQLGWDLVPCDGGPITGESMQAWLRALEAVARELSAGARVSASRSPAAAAARARQLAAWKAEWDVDAQVVLAAPEGRTYDGVAMWDALTSLGLHWGDGDFFHWVNPHREAGDDYLFSVGTSTPPGYFFPEEAVAGRLHVEDLDFGFSVPRSRDPLAVFDAMMRGIRYVQRRLGGDVLGEDGPLDEEAVRREIQRVVESMERAGIRAGSDAALRLI